jgi:hypothetical protein
MRLEKMLDEANVRDMAKELVSFQQWMEKEVMDKARNPEKAKDILIEAFKDLEKEIKRAIKEK